MMTMSKAKKAAPVDDITALREATREGHEVLKGIHEATKKLQEMRKQIEKDICEHFQQHVDGVVSDGLAKYETQLLGFIRESEGLIHKRFDDLAKALMGDTPEDRKQRRPNLEEIMKVVTWVREGSPDLSAILAAADG
jgi:hypothetical protein